MPSQEESPSTSQGVSLMICQVIRASAERLFAAWTQPEHLKKWWGPGDVECVEAEVDLRIGGSYRLANQFPTGQIVWILGEFEAVEPPHLLVYTWRIGTEKQSRVTVRFEPHAEGTEVTVLHEEISTPATRDSHERGWLSCLEGLIEYIGSEDRS